MEEVKACINDYFESYKSIIDRYYPAHGKNGFTERSMTIRFVSTIEKKCNGYFSWHEVPVPDSKGGNRQHLDAVIFGKDGGEIYFVESKHFSNREGKIKEIGRDINRMFNPKVLEVVCKGLRTPHCSTRVFGIVLADVWLTENENDLRNKIYKSWKNGSFFKCFEETLKLENNFIGLHKYESYSYDTQDPQSGEVFKHGLLALIFEM